MCSSELLLIGSAHHIVRRCAVAGAKALGSQRVVPTASPSVGLCVPEPHVRHVRRCMRGPLMMAAGPLCYSTGTSSLRELSERTAFVLTLELLGVADPCMQRSHC